MSGGSSDPSHEPARRLRHPALRSPRRGTHAYAYAYPDSYPHADADAVCIVDLMAADALAESVAEPIGISVADAESEFVAEPEFDELAEALRSGTPTFRR